MMFSAWKQNTQNGRGGINCASELLNMTLTATQLLEGGVEIARILEAQENRMNPLPQMQSFYNFCDHLFRLRGRYLHCDPWSAMNEKLTSSYEDPIRMVEPDVQKKDKTIIRLIYFEM